MNPGLFRQFNINMLLAAFINGEQTRVILTDMLLEMYCYVIILSNGVNEVNGCDIFMHFFPYIYSQY